MLDDLSQLGNSSADVVTALHSVGAGVQSLSRVGDGCPGLLVAFRGTWHVLCFKDGSKPPSHRKLTPEEQMWLFRFDELAPVYIVNSIEEALEVIGAI